MFMNIHVKFVTTESIELQEKQLLVERFKNAKVINGTLRYHNFASIPGCLEKVNVKRYSFSSTEKTVSVTKKNRGHAGGQGQRGGQCVRGRGRAGHGRGGRRG